MGNSFGSAKRGVAQCEEGAREERGLARILTEMARRDEPSSKDVGTLAQGRRSTDSILDMQQSHFYRHHPLRLSAEAQVLLVGRLTACADPELVCAQDTLLYLLPSREERLDSYCASSAERIDKL